MKTQPDEVELYAHVRNIYGIELGADGQEYADYLRDKYGNQKTQGETDVRINNNQD